MRLTQPVAPFNFVAPVSSLLRGEILALLPPISLAQTTGRPMKIVSQISLPQKTPDPFEFSATEKKPKKNSARVKGSLPRKLDETNSNFTKYFPKLVGSAFRVHPVNLLNEKFLPPTHPGRNQVVNKSRKRWPEAGGPSPGLEMFTLPCSHFP